MPQMLSKLWAVPVRQSYVRAVSEVRRLSSGCNIRPIADTGDGESGEKVLTNQEKGKSQHLPTWTFL